LNPKFILNRQRFLWIGFWGGRKDVANPGEKTSRIPAKRRREFPFSYARLTHRLCFDSRIQLRDWLRLFGAGSWRVFGPFVAQNRQKHVVVPKPCRLVLPRCGPEVRGTLPLLAVHNDLGAGINVCARRSAWIDQLSEFGCAAPVNLASNLLPYISTIYAILIN